MRSRSPVLSQGSSIPSWTHPPANVERWIWCAIVVLALGGTLALADGLRFAPVKDEVYFLQAATFLGHPFPPTLEQLGGYSVMQTPLAFLVWGLLGRLTGDVLLSGRLLDLALAGAIIGLVAVRRGVPFEQRLLPMVGLATYPYLFPLGVHLYTDVPAAFLALAGVSAHVRGRPRTAVILFALAIATRQYMVAFPVGVAAWEWSRSARQESHTWLEGALAAVGAASLLGWFAFFGGLAPKAGESRWISGYPDPMMHASIFLIDYGLYFLAALGAYFVVPELLLFRERAPWRGLASSRNAVIALGLLLLFAVCPPSFDSDHGGALVRAVRLVLPSRVADGPGLVLTCYVLALLTALRFTRRLDLGFWIVAVNFVLMTKTQLAWDKYYLPIVAVLWFLKAEGMLAVATEKTSRSAQRVLSLPSWDPFPPALAAPRHHGR